MLCVSRNPSDHIIWAVLPHAQKKNNLAVITEFLLEEKS